MAMDLNFASFILSVVSIVIGIFSLVISVIFYNMTTSTYKDTTKLTHEIDKKLIQLSQLSDWIHNDLYTLLSDTLLDMRKYVWTESDNKVTNVVKEKMESEANKIIHESLKDLKNQEKRITLPELELVVNKIIEEYINTENEIKNETLSVIIKEKYQELKKFKNVIFLNDFLFGLKDIAPLDIVRELNKLKEREECEFVDPLNPKSVITFK